MEESKIIIDITKMTKTYEIGKKIKVKALRGTNLKILEGEFVSIMGPSGSGKSTLMNMIGCLDVPTSGTYFLDGIDISKLNDNQLAEIRNKKVGFVFQTFNLLPRANIFHNVGLPPIYSKNKKGNTNKKILDAIESVGLTDWIKHRPNELSGGQKQRVAIARALVNNPTIILADEPTGNLDSRTEEEIMAIFQELNSRGKTIIIITHEMDIAKHTKRIIYLKDGIISSKEKIENPVDALKKLAETPKLEDTLSSV